MCNSRRLNRKHFPVDALQRQLGRIVRREVLGFRQMRDRQRTHSAILRYPNPSSTPVLSPNDFSSMPIRCSIARYRLQSGVFPAARTRRPGRSVPLPALVQTRRDERK